MQFFFKMSAFIIVGLGAFLLFSTCKIQDPGGGTQPPPPVNDQPVVKIGADRKTVIGETLTFRNSSSDSDGTIDSYDWDFGDESTHRSTSEASHTYTTAATYTLTLTVTDDDGATDTDSMQVAVYEDAFTFDLTYTSAEPLDDGNPIGIWLFEKTTTGVTGYIDEQSGVAMITSAGSISINVDDMEYFSPYKSYYAIFHHDIGNDSPNAPTPEDYFATYYYNGGDNVSTDANSCQVTDLGFILNIPADSNSLLTPGTYSVTYPAAGWQSFVGSGSIIVN